MEFLGAGEVKVNRAGEREGKVKSKPGRLGTNDFRGTRRKIEDGNNRAGEQKAQQELLGMARAVTMIEEKRRVCW